MGTLVYIRMQLCARDNRKWTFTIDGEKELLWPSVVREIEEIIIGYIYLLFVHAEE